MTKPKGFYPGWIGKTRCGWECGVYATDGDGGLWPIHGWIVHPRDGKQMAVRFADGSYAKHSQCDLDFILEPSPPETREVWVNFYSDYYATVHPSQDRADKHNTGHREGDARKAILTFVEDEI